MSFSGYPFPEMDMGDYVTGSSYTKGNRTVEYDIKIITDEIERVIKNPDTQMTRSVLLLVPGLLDFMRRRINENYERAERFKEELEVVRKTTNT